MVIVDTGQGVYYNNFMDKRGPKRLVTGAVKVGEYGHTSWHVELDCGHALKSQRKPKVGESRLCCRTCVAPPAPPALFAELGDEVYEFDMISDLKVRAAIASKVGVPIDQVDLRGGTATVFIDALQLRVLLAGS